MIPQSDILSGVFSVMEGAIARLESADEGIVGGDKEGSRYGYLKRC